MTFRHCDGAESQDTSWVGAQSGVVALIATGGHSGAYHYRFEAAESGPSISLPLAPSGRLSDSTAITDLHILFGFAIRLADATPTTEIQIAVIEDTAGGVLLSLNVETDGDLRFVDNVGTTLLTVATPFTDATFHVVELVFEHVGSNGNWELFIDGDTVGSGANGDFDAGNEPHRCGFNGSLAEQDVDIDDFYVLSDSSAPTPIGASLEVWPFQAGSGATATGALDFGSVTDIDNLPFAGVDIRLESDNSEWTVETDAAGDALAGPSGASEIDGDSNIRGAVWNHELLRTNGSSPDSLDQAWGNDATLTYTDRASTLSTAPQHFFVTSGDQAAELPLSTEHFEYGLRKTGSGGRDIHATGIFAQLLHSAASAPASMPVFHRPLRIWDKVRRI